MGISTHSVICTSGLCPKTKYLCIHTQKGLNTDLFVNGLPYFEKKVRDVVIEHRKMEEDVGNEIYLARRRAQTS